MTPRPSLGTPVARLEAVDKVTGAARYASEYPAERRAYAWIVGAQVARGRIRAIDAAPALRAPGVVAVLTHENAPRLEDVDDHELDVLQSARVSYRGQTVALVVADSLEEAREAAALVRVEYDVEEHDSVLREDHPALYAPEQVNAGYETDTAQGDFDAAFADAAVRIDTTVRTAAYHNNPMEPHATTAEWRPDGTLVVHDSTQGAPSARSGLAEVLGLDPDRVRVIAPHVGGGFGSKGTPRPNIVLAAIAARAVDRPVKLAVTRQQMFQITGYRTPTIQRMRLGADADGRLVAIAHDAQVQTSTVREFVEQAATPSRVMYAAPHRRTTHRVAALDVPTPSWMRAPGECPGMFAVEAAMDELAVATGVDPVELRIRNEPEVSPEDGSRFSSRNLVACLREGAERFGWADRDPTPRSRRDGALLLGTGVAASAYPTMRNPAQATARARPGGRFAIEVGAADIGTGARTVLGQIAADALGVALERVDVAIGDSALPPAPVAGGSAGTASWGS
ncbi:xanthine dehydrogenase family protein molybdopterin-binding subunit, partial [Patulibacter sp. S7RM1-6]